MPTSRVRQGGTQRHEPTKDGNTSTSGSQNTSDVHSRSYDDARRQRARARTAERKRARDMRHNRVSGRPSQPSTGGISDRVRSFSQLYQRQLLVLGSVLLVLVLITALDAGANWGKIYAGVHIGTVDVSGMTVEEAAEAVEHQYGSQIEGTVVHIYADDATMQKAQNGEAIENIQESEYVSAEEAAKKRKVWDITATEVQARLYPETLAQRALAVGRDDGGLSGRLSAQTFGWEIEPTLEMSDSAIESLGKSIDRAIGNAHVDYNIDLSEGVAVVTAGHPGTEVNRKTLREEITKRLLGSAEDEGFVATAEDAPVRIGQEEAQAVADKVNNAIAYGATFSFGDVNWEATTYDLASLITTKVIKDGDSWSLDVHYNTSAAKSALLTNLNSTYSRQNVKVRFTQNNGTTMVESSSSGEMPEVGKAVSELESVTLESQPTSTPVIVLSGVEIPNAMTIDSAIDYGIVSEISTYETEYTGGATNRNTNIHLAADLINNSIVKANGGTWSFNQVAGECNEAKGFKGAGVIVGNEVVDDIGGGICQVATTVFNAVYEAGLPVDERSNHSLYIASYPAGRDAAISWPEPDLVWRNDTQSDILLQTSYTDETITVTLLGVDPGYTVESEEGEFKDGDKHGVITEIDNTLERGETQLKQAGVDGTSIDVIRTVKDANGNIVRKDTFTSVYDAQDEIILVGPNTDIDLSEYVDDETEEEDDSESSGESEDSDEDYESDVEEYEG